ncbi:MAG: cupin domain-containing protein [Microcoleaceae cyanobacterium]
MTSQLSVSVKDGENFAAVNLGDFSQLHQYSFDIPEKDFKVSGKAFLNQILNLTSAEVSLNNLAPKKSIPFYHKHRLNEEIYIVVQGEGEFQVNDKVFSIKQGSVVKVNPEGERCLRNTSDTENLCFIVIQSRINSHPDSTIEDGFATEKQVSWVGKEQI